MGYGTPSGAPPLFSAELASLHLGDGGPPVQQDLVPTGVTDRLLSYETVIALALDENRINNTNMFSRQGAGVSGPLSRKNDPHLVLFSILFSQCYRLTFS